VANYIRKYFSNLLTEDERLAVKHHMYTYKTSDNPKMRKLMVRRGWISEQPEIQEFLKNGYDEFESNVAQRIMEECPEKIYLNNCPKCSGLARTPYSRQCRHCGFSWHDINEAKFRLKSSFQLTGRQFFLLGQITKGEVKKGHYMDLTMLGLNKKPKIKVIEYALKRQDGLVWEDIGLGTNELTQEDKEYLKRIGSFGTPFDIVNER